MGSMRAFAFGLAALVAATSVVVACSSFSADEPEPAADAGGPDAPPDVDPGVPTCTTPAFVDDPAARPDTTCGADQATVDLTTSAAHCGACDHACGAGSECASGACTPVLLFGAQLPVTALVSGNTVYFVDAKNKVQRGDLTTGKAESLSFAQVVRATSVRHLALDAKWLYVSERGEQQRLRVIGTDVELLKLQSSDRTGVAAPARTGYFYAAPEGVEKHKDDGSFDTLYGSPGTTSVLADGDVPFWISKVTDGFTLATRPAGGESKVLATVPAVDGIALDATYVYMADAATSRLIRRVPRNGGSSERVAVESGTAVSDLQLDGDYVYWTSLRAGAWSLLRVAKCGGLPLLLVRDVAQLSQISFDDRYVYVASYANPNKSDLLRIAK